MIQKHHYEYSAFRGKQMLIKPIKLKVNGESSVSPRNMGKSFINHSLRFLIEHGLDWGEEMQASKQASKQGESYNSDNTKEPIFVS